MKTVKRSAEYTVLQRGDGRYAVRGTNKKWINGDAKVDILVNEGLLKERPSPKPQPAEPEESVAESPAGEEAG